MAELAQPSVRLIKEAEQLAREAASRPELKHFLSALPPNTRPYCAIFSEADHEVAAICGYESCFGPFRGGVINLDLALSWFRELKPARNRILRLAVRILLHQPGIRMIRATVGDASECDAIRCAAPHQWYDVSSKQIESGIILHSSAALNDVPPISPNCSYVPYLPPQAFRRATWDLIENGAQVQGGGNVPRCLALIEQAENHLLSGIRRSDGTWLSVAGGWFEGSRLVLALQVSQSSAVALRTRVLQRAFNSERMTDVLLRGAFETKPKAEQEMPVHYLSQITIEKRRIRHSVLQRLSSLSAHLYSFAKLGNMPRLSE